MLRRNFWRKFLIVRTHEIAPRVPLTQTDSSAGKSGQCSILRSANYWQHWLQGSLLNRSFRATKLELHSVYGGARL